MFIAGLRLDRYRYFPPKPPPVVPPNEPNLAGPPRCTLLIQRQGGHIFSPERWVRWYAVAVHR